MAKVNMPLLSGDVSGKFGSIVFFKRGNLNIARVKVRPSNPNTQKQQIVRENIRNLGILWKNAGTNTSVTLHKRNSDGSYTDITAYATYIDQTAWRNYTIYSKSGYPLKGYQAFIAEALKKLSQGQDPCATPTCDHLLTEAPQQS